MTVQSLNNSATAFQVQNAAGASILTVDTTGNQAILGSNNSTNGQLVVDSSGASGYVGLTVSTTAFTGYTITLPSAAPGASQCLQSPSAAPYTTLVWGACGGSQHPKEIILTPEYAGAVLDSGGQTSDVGTMTSGLDTGTGLGSGNESYYEWTTTQSTAQTYDVVVQIPLPSDFSSWSSTTPITIDDEATAGGALSAALWDTSGTIATNWSYTSNTPGCSLAVSTTWATQTGCAISGGTWAANGIITLRIRLSAAASGGITKLGNIKLSYTSAY